MARLCSSSRGINQGMTCGRNRRRRWRISVTAWRHRNARTDLPRLAEHCCAPVHTALYVAPALCRAALIFADAGTRRATLLVDMGNLHTAPRAHASRSISCTRARIIRTLFTALPRAPHRAHAPRLRAVPLAIPRRCTLPRCVAACYALYFGLLHRTPLPAAHARRRAFAHTRLCRWPGYTPPPHARA